MPNKMLIDATHPEETRVVVLRGNRVEEFDFESANRKQLRGNIYLAKVTRVEPSLQAAFVDYGGNRHGFLAFSEIHPDYYRIPVSDRSGVNGEAHSATERAAANGDDEAGVPLAVALPEPVPVAEMRAAGDGSADEAEPFPADTGGGDTMAATELALGEMPPESVEAAEMPEEAEPTLAAWQEEAALPREPAAEDRDADIG